jgi:deazaflavin-dependent oxidoreductase (nitroreductase family)
MCLPEPGGSLLVSGSNWGKHSHPSWTANLLAHPQVEIVYRRVRLPVTAQLLDGEERERSWPLLEAQWPGYREYERAAGHAIRVFRLLPR